MTQPLRLALWMGLALTWSLSSLMFWALTRLQAIAWLALLPPGLARWAIGLCANTPASVAIAVLLPGLLCLWLCARRALPLWVMPLLPLLVLGLTLTYGRIDFASTAGNVLTPARQGDVAETREQSLIQMAQYGLPRETRALLQAGTNPNAIDPQGKTALARSRELKVTQILLEAGAKPDGTALSEAAFWGDRQAVAALLNATPDNGRALVAEAGDEALLFAAGIGTQPSGDADRAAIVQMLLERGANPNARTSDGETARERAIAMGYSQVAAVLERASAAN